MTAAGSDPPPIRVTAEEVARVRVCGAPAIGRIQSEEHVRGMLVLVSYR